MLLHLYWRNVRRPVMCLLDLVPEIRYLEMSDHLSEDGIFFGMIGGAWRRAATWIGEERSRLWLNYRMLVQHYYPKKRRRNGSDGGCGGTCIAGSRVDEFATLVCRCPP